jgi:hypothetical protein
MAKSKPNFFYLLRKMNSRQKYDETDVVGKQSQLNISSAEDKIEAPNPDVNAHMLMKKKTQYRLKTNEFKPFEHEEQLLSTPERQGPSFQPFSPQPTFKPTNDSTTKRATQYLLSTFMTCNPTYNFQPINNPKRFITKLSEPAKNDFYDNAEYDYILSVNDILGSTEGHQFQVLDSLGCGTFGQVVKCRNIKTKELIALKVIKNKTAYYKQSLVEVTILDLVF